MAKYPSTFDEIFTATLFHFIKCKKIDVKSPKALIKKAIKQEIFKWKRRRSAKQEELHQKDGKYLFKEKKRFTYWTQFDAEKHIIIDQPKAEAQMMEAVIMFWLGKFPNSTYTDVFLRYYNGMSTKAICLHYSIEPAYFYVIIGKVRKYLKDKGLEFSKDY
ncbi:hypothetical protein KFE98_01625 [bacterium SCSIO 12741]|nr:hypothetical protein KFE98_01625 [bacterium SCSIO 12741]